MNKESFIVVITFGLSGILSWSVSGYTHPGEGGVPYKSDGDARLPLGCKLQILVSLRVFGVESHYICPFWCRIGLCIKNFTKNALTLTTQKSPLGVNLSLSHAHICLPHEFNLDFLTSIPVTFIWESPRDVHTNLDIFESAYFSYTNQSSVQKNQDKKYAGFKNISGLVVDMATGIQVVMINRGARHSLSRCKGALAAEQGLYNLTISSSSSSSSSRLGC